MLARKHESRVTRRADHASIATLQSRWGMGMADLKLTLTCADYGRVMPLVTGHVRPEGIDLTLEIGNNGSWPERAEMLRRAHARP